MGTAGRTLQNVFFEIKFIEKLFWNSQPGADHVKSYFNKVLKHYLLFIKHSFQLHKKCQRIGSLGHTRFSITVSESVFFFFFFFLLAYCVSAFI